MYRSLHCCKFLCVTFLFVFLGCHSSKETKESTEKKSYEFTTIRINKLYHDFGDVKEGEILGCFFVVENTGNDPLIIQGIELGCGCMSADYSKKPIKPGHSTDVEVKFNSNGFHGKQYKVIQLSANIREKVKELVIAANVIN